MLQTNNKHFQISSIIFVKMKITGKRNVEELQSSAQWLRCVDWDDLHVNWLHGAWIYKIQIHRTQKRHTNRDEKRSWSRWRFLSYSLPCSLPKANCNSKVQCVAWKVLYHCLSWERSSFLLEFKCSKWPFQNKNHTINPFHNIMDGSVLRQIQISILHFLTSLIALYKWHLIINSTMQMTSDN